MRKLVFFAFFLILSPSAFSMGGTLANLQLRTFAGSYHLVKGEDCTNYLGVKLLGNMFSSDSQIEIEGGHFSHFKSSFVIKGINKGLLCNEACEKAELKDGRLLFSEIHNAGIASWSNNLILSTPNQNQLQMDFGKVYNALGNAFNFQIEATCLYAKD